jgi:formylglycine-generating enzyme
MFRRAVLFAAVSAAVFACKFEPHFDANGIACGSSKDCPSGYACAKAAGLSACCNTSDLTACLPAWAVECAMVGTCAGPPPDASAGGAGGGTPSGTGGGGGGGGGAGGATAGPDLGVTPAGCADVCGSSASCGDCPAMLAAALGRFAIDSTEVTQAQFALFVATTPSLGFLPAGCAWKTSYGPAEACASSAATSPDQPAVCVDWCDAAAYCAWARKRLCGHVGGGALVFADYAVASASQWHQACTSNGAHPYPYGDAYAAGACNVSDADGGFSSLGNVKTAAGCHAPAAPWNQVSDLSGNAAEWEDACNATLGPNDFCRARGGSYLSTLDQARCGADFSAPRNTTSPTIGFRCCSNP